MNKFGGDWTESKIEILVEYAKAYLTIMSKYAARHDWKLLYFDGFAGSGEIKKGNDENQKIIIGAATRIVEIEIPRPFDLYYFVEKDPNNVKSLEIKLNKEKKSNIHIINTDCNEKILAMSNFLKTPRGKKFKTLAYIDPYGMQLNWESIVSLQKLNVDAWILIPTGMGVNRLLTTTGQISNAWLERLELFLGMERTEILKYFYDTIQVNTLFGMEDRVYKKQKAIEKSAELYKERLGELFKFVSEPYVIKNKSNSIMFHFLMVSNNKTASKVANQIIKKYNNGTIIN